MFTSCELQSNTSSSVADALQPPSSNAAFSIRLEKAGLLPRKFCMSRLLQLGDDKLNHMLNWLDIVGICCVDMAVGNARERALWLKYLRT